MLSILMPAYNTASFIAEAIESVLAQTFTDFELLIADDASTDNTFKIASAFSKRDNRIKVFRQSRNLGFVGNKNFLLQQATGDYLAWQDSDDISYPDRIKKQMQAISDFDVEIIATNLNRLRYIDHNWQQVNARLVGKGSFFITDISSNTPFMYPTLLFSRNVLNRYGYFNKYFNRLLGEDFYWAMKANKEFPIYFIDEILYGYRVNYNSTTNVFSERKLIMTHVLTKLQQQYNTTGTDWLKEEKFDELKDYEEKLLDNRKLISEQYRIWAAKAIDKQDFNQARELLIKSVQQWPFNLNYLRTLIYYFRSYSTTNK